MRRQVIAMSGLLLGMAAVVLGQSMPASTSMRGDAALTYQWVRTNTQPGQCGCFGVNGGGVSASWNFSPKWSAVAETGAGFASNGPGTGSSLTLASFLGGARYYAPYAWHPEGRSILPFIQLLAGMAHAGGGIAGAGDSTFAFETRIGGGLDLPIGSHFAVRVLQADYDLTRFKNGVNDHQNNLLLGGGLVFRWMR